MEIIERSNKMKKFLSIIKKTTAVSLCAAVIGSAAVCIAPDSGFSITASAAALKTFGDFNYWILKDSTVSISSYNGNDDNVYIPDTIDGHTVSKIAENSFSDTDIVTVTLPDTVKIIERYAFAGCSSLRSIYIPDTVESIDPGAFGFRDEEEVYLRTVTGRNGSAAEAFAQENDFDFVPVDGETTEPTSIKLSKTYLSLEKGNKEAITAAVFPNYASDKSVTWESSDSSTASVENGEITALSAGTAYISAKTCNGLTAVCRVTVKNPTIPVTALKLDKTGLSLGEGESYKLNVTISPSDAAPKTVRWSSSDSSIVSVSSGYLVGKKIGTATITAYTPSGVKAICMVSVKKAPSTVSLSKSTLSLGIGESFTLSAVLPTDSAAAVRTFSTTDSSILKMTKTYWTAGFTGTKPGTALVKVKLYNGKEASCRVNVRPAPDKVTISKSAMTMGVGETGTLSCSIPANTAAATRTFRTSNSKVIKMTKTDWTGGFTAVGEGTAWVTVRTFNGKESSCKITVKPAPASIELYAKKKVMSPGQTAVLKYHIAPSGSAATPSFVSSNTSVCTVSKEGVIKAVKDGSAVITVSTQNGKKDTCNVLVTSSKTIISSDTSNKIPLNKYFNALNQYPELPTGCEITSLTATLNFYGYNVSKLTMSDYYLEKGEAMKTDFHYAFAGEPRSKYSYGCYAPAIVKAANKYLTEKQSSLRARQLSGYTFDDLFSFTDSGTPVIVWATMGLSQSYYTQSWTASNGQRVTWLAGEHCMVLLGGNSNVVYAADPEYGTIKTYSRSLFKKRYEELFSQAVVIQ